MAENKFDTTVASLFKGMDGFLSAKTVVGEPVTVNDTIILPLVDVSVLRQVPEMVPIRIRQQAEWAER